MPWLLILCSSDCVLLGLFDVALVLVYCWFLLFWLIAWLRVSFVFVCDYVLY